jgi:hypothetical protein
VQTLWTIKVTWLWHEVNKLLFASRAEFKNEWNSTYSPPMSSLIAKGNLYLRNFRTLNNLCVNYEKFFFLPLFSFFWRNRPQWATSSSITRFLHHTQRRTTVSRTPLGEWSVRRRDLYLTTHNTHNRQTSLPPVGFELTISASERSQTYAVDRADTGISNYKKSEKQKCSTISRSGERPRFLSAA